MLFRRGETPLLFITTPLAHSWPALAQGFRQAKKNTKEAPTRNDQAPEVTVETWLALACPLLAPKVETRLFSTSGSIVLNLVGFWMGFWLNEVCEHKLKIFNTFSVNNIHLWFFLSFNLQ